MIMQVEVKGKNEQVDWTKNPQLVINDDGLVVQTLIDQSKSSDEYCFVGSPLNDREGMYRVDSFYGWVKNAFKPFHGEIWLKND